MSMAPSSSPSSRWSRGAKPSAAKSRGGADLSQHDVVVLAAGRRAVLDHVADRVDERGQLLLGRVGRGLQRLDPVGRAPWPARAARPSPRPWPRPPACRAPSARRAAARTRSGRPGAARPRRGSRRRPPRPRRGRAGWPARCRGRSRTSLMSITARAYRRRHAARADPTRGGSPVQDLVAGDPPEHRGPRPHPARGRRGAPPRSRCSASTTPMPTTSSTAASPVGAGCAAASTLGVTTATSVFVVSSAAAELGPVSSSVIAVDGLVESAEVAAAEWSRVLGRSTSTG